MRQSIFANCAEARATAWSVWHAARGCESLDLELVRAGFAKFEDVMACSSLFTLFRVACMPELRTGSRNWKLIGSP